MGTMQQLDFIKRHTNNARILNRPAHSKGYEYAKATETRFPRHQCACPYDRTSTRSHNTYTANSDRSDCGPTRTRHSGLLPESQYNKSHFQCVGTGILELHHVNQISKDGEIFDMDNIRIVTPKRHSEIHKGDK
ncbi:MAG: hypothetical protein WBH22_21410 [Pseudomonas mandelii]|uniref:hypothetical protein n=1 Tax=Pseudomonas mandelii TaxID=75612 RepID=UPI003C74938C